MPLRCAKGFNFYLIGGIALSEQVLLTGAGQVGAQMIKILNEEYAVTPFVLDLHFDFEYLDTIVPREWYVPIQGSVLDKTLVDSILRDHAITRITHSAAILPMRVGHDPHPGFFEVNVHGTSNMIFAAINAQVRRFLMFSTNGVYQFQEHGVTGPIDEDYPTGLTRHNSYGNSKATAEYLLKELTRAGSIEGRIIRPGEIYGPVFTKPGDDDLYWKAMFDAAIKGESYVLSGHPEHRLDWVYCKDVAKAACKILMKDKVASEVYNVTFGQCIGIYDIKSELDRQYPNNKVMIEECETGGWKYPLSNERLKKEIFFEPGFSLSRGIQDYARWLGKTVHRETR